MAHPVEPAASADDLRLVEALRSGDEAAFISLFERFHPALVRLARIYVPSRVVAEEVAQEAWLGVLEGLDRFEEHLAICPGCRVYLEQMRQTIRLLGKLTEESIPPKARRDLLDTFRDWKKGRSKP